MVWFQSFCNFTDGMFVCVVLQHILKLLLLLCCECVDVCLWNSSNTYVYVCVFMKQQVYLYVCVWICCVCVCVSCVVWSCNNQMIIMCLIVWQILVLLEINRQNDQKWMCCACMNMLCVYECVCCIFVWMYEYGGGIWVCGVVWICDFWNKKCMYVCVVCFDLKKLLNISVCCDFWKNFVWMCVLHVCVWMYCVVCCMYVYECIVLCVVWMYMLYVLWMINTLKNEKKIKLLLLVVLKQQQ